MDSNLHIPSALWAESDSDTTLLPPMRPTFVPAEKLSSFWKSLSGHLSPELRLPGGVDSSDPKTSYLASAMLQLQQAVKQQFQFLNIKDTANLAYEKPTCTDSWVPSPSFETKDHDLVGCNKDVSGSKSVSGGSSQARSASISFPDDKKYIPHSSNKARRASSAEFSKNTEMDHYFENLEDDFSQSELPEAYDGCILAKLLENIRFKISKAKWTRDLQEFTADYSLSAAQFGKVRDSMVRAGRKLGRRWVQNMSNSLRRPCWGISGNKLLEAFGEREGKKFNAMGNALQASLDFGINVHMIYILYDFDREQISVKAICSPIDEAILGRLCEESESETL